MRIKARKNSSTRTTVPVTLSSSDETASSATRGAAPLPDRLCAASSTKGRTSKCSLRSRLLSVSGSSRESWETITPRSGVRIALRSIRFPSSSRTKG